MEKVTIHENIKEGPSSENKFAESSDSFEKLKMEFFKSLKIPQVVEWMSKFLNYLERFKRLGEAALEMAIDLDVAASAVNAEPKRISLSGKISGLHPEIASQNFRFSEHELYKFHKADEVVNPFSIRPFLRIRCWLCYMIADIREQSTCTHSAFRWDWKDSRGAVIEYFFARFIFKQDIIWLV